MSELARLHETDAPLSDRPDWFPSAEEISKRPLEYGIAIDPPDSHEIDDAIWVEPLDENNEMFRYKVHIADGGLLTDTPHIQTAREKGWTEYFDDGSADYMLPKHVTSMLDLDRDAGEEGQPAMTVSFIAGEDTPPTDFDIYKSRLDCVGMTYKTFARRVRQHFHPDNSKTYEEEALIFSASRYLRGSNRAEKNYRRVLNTIERQRVPFYDDHASYMNGYFMRWGNIGMARVSIEDETPYIFRNHHISHFDHPEGSMIREIYPDSDLFAQNNIAWYSRIPTQHEGINEPVYGHATSPLRRAPDLFNHVNRSAVLESKKPPFNDDFLDDLVRELAEKMKQARHLGSTALIDLSLSA